MIEIYDVREWACRLCGAVERLSKGQPDPEKCPRCNDGEACKYEGGRSDSWTA